MSEHELVVAQRDWSRSSDYTGSTICLVGVIVLFFYPLHGIGLLLLGGFMICRACAHLIIATTMATSEQLAEIADHLGELRRRG